MTRCNAPRACAGTDAIRRQVLRVRRPGQRIQRIVVALRAVFAQQHGLLHRIFRLGVRRPYSHVVILHKCQPVAVGRSHRMRRAVHRRRGRIVPAILVVRRHLRPRLLRAGVGRQIAAPCRSLVHELHPRARRVHVEVVERQRLRLHLFAQRLAQRRSQARMVKGRLARPLVSIHQHKLVPPGDRTAIDKPLGPFNPLHVIGQVRHQVLQLVLQIQRPVVVGRNHARRHPGRQHTESSGQRNRKANRPAPPRSQGENPVLLLNAHGT